MIEYVIWGRVWNKETKTHEAEEVLLVNKMFDKQITEKALANKAVERLTKKFNCAGVRIQEIDMTSKNLSWDFVKAARL